jgi:hypothetical protein
MDSGRGSPCWPGGFVLVAEIGALDRCFFPERYPEARLRAASSHARGWDQAPAPRLPGHAIAKERDASRGYRLFVRVFIVEVLIFDALDILSPEKADALLAAASDLLADL